MNCNHISPDIMTKFLTDDLSAEERRTAELHLAVCPECAAKLDEQRRFEDAAARSYPRTFSGRLDPEGEKAIDDAVRERLNAPEVSPAWKKRIRGTVAVQLGAVAAVALMLLVMIVLPSRPKSKAAPVRKKAAKAVQTVQVVPAAVPAETKSRPAAAVVQEAVEPETEEEEDLGSLYVMEALNPGLVRLFSLNEISLRPPEKSSFREGAICMYSPFEKGICILLAAAPGKAEQPESSAGLRIVPRGKTVLLSELSRSGESDVVSAALLNLKKNQADFVFAAVMPSEAGDAPLFQIAEKDVLQDSVNAPAQLRLAAVMHAAGKPRILLNREIRKKMLEELESLAKNEYAGDLRIALFLEKLRKVK